MPNEIITVDNQNEIITSSNGINRFKNLEKGENQGYFNRVFKRFTGLTPLAYRRSY